MEHLLEELRRVAVLLDHTKRPWALVGGLAFAVRAEPRSTTDIDFAVAVAGDNDADAVIREFRAAGYEVHQLLEQVRHGRIATVRLVPTMGEDSIVVDLLFSSCGIE